MEKRESLFFIGTDNDEKREMRIGRMAMHLPDEIRQTGIDPCYDMERSEF